MKKFLLPVAPEMDVFTLQRVCQSFSFIYRHEKSIALATERSEIDETEIVTDNIKHLSKYKEIKVINPFTS